MIRARPSAHWMVLTSLMLFGVQSPAKDVKTCHWNGEAPPRTDAAQTALNHIIDASAVRYDETFGDQDDLKISGGEQDRFAGGDGGMGPTTSDAIGIAELDEGL